MIESCGGGVIQFQSKVISIRRNDVMIVDVVVVSVFVDLANDWMASVLNIIYLRNHVFIIIIVSPGSDLEYICLIIIVIPLCWSGEDVQILLSSLTDQK